MQMPLCTAIIPHRKFIKSNIRFPFPANELVGSVACVDLALCRCAFNSRLLSIERKSDSEVESIAI